MYVYTVIVRRLWAKIHLIWGYGWDTVEKSFPICLYGAFRSENRPFCGLTLGRRGKVTLNYSGRAFSNLVTSEYVDN